MNSFESKLDRNIARSFLHAPTTAISYRSIPMTNETNQLMMRTTPLIDIKENISEDWNPQIGYPINSNIHPMYYDVIIDTITDYDIFYPIAKRTRKYYCNPQHDHEEQSFHPKYCTQRLDEHTVSMNFTHDYESISNWSNSSRSDENRVIRYEPIQSMKTVRFNDIPTCIPYSQTISMPQDQYYFYPEASTPIDIQSPSIRYITTPFFWFRPVLDHNYAICIPTTRPSLHAFLTPSFDSSPLTDLTPNPIRF